jgi:hypothetical protein
MPGAYYVHKQIYYYNFPLLQRVGNAKKETGNPKHLPLIYKQNSCRFKGTKIYPHVTLLVIKDVQ